MNRRKQWMLLLCLGLLLLVVGGAVAVRQSIRFQRAVWSEFRESCLAQVTTLEEYAEYWILRNQMDSITVAARLLLFGNGLYVDVVLPGETLFSEQAPDVDVSLIPDPIDLDELVIAGSLVLGNAGDGIRLLGGSQLIMNQTVCAENAGFDVHAITTDCPSQDDLAASVFTGLVLGSGNVYPETTDASGNQLGGLCPADLFD